MAIRDAIVFNGAKFQNAVSVNCLDVVTTKGELFIRTQDVSYLANILIEAIEYFVYAENGRGR